MIDDPDRFDAVTILGVDQHAWRHTNKGDIFVIVTIDLTPVPDAAGPSRLRDVVEGRSKQAFKQWTAAGPQAWRDTIEVVAMDAFIGFKTVVVEELPDAVTVMDPFLAVRLGADPLDKCRRRAQSRLHGHRGRKDDLLYRARRAVQTRVSMLAEK